MTNKKKHTPQTYQPIDKQIDTIHENTGEYSISGNETSTDFIMPEGYVSGDEFSRRVKEGLRKKLRDNGYL